MKKFISALSVLLMLLLCCTPFTASAADKFYSDKSGKIEISLKYPDTKEPVVGAGISLYRVGEVIEFGGELKYALTQSYIDSGASLKCDGQGNFDTSSAKILTQYVEQKGISGICAKTDNNGSAHVGSCKVGVYLVTFEMFTRDLSYSAPDSFLISMPATTELEGLYDYNVNASPKLSISGLGGGSSESTKHDDTDFTMPTDPTDPTKPSDITDNSTTPTNNDNSTTQTDNTSTTGSDNPSDNTSRPDVSDPNPNYPTGPNNNGNSGNNGNNGNNSSKPPQLPNTGMLMWPIPVLSVAGPLFFAFGYLDVISRKRKDEED